MTPLTVALQALVADHGGSWTGSVSDLQAELAGTLPPDLQALDATRLSAVLRSEVPALQAVGIAVTPPVGGGRGGRVWTIARAGAKHQDDAPLTDDTLDGQISEARDALRRALLAGNDTRPHRAVLEALEGRAARQVAAEQAAAARVARARQDAIGARAAELADAAAATLAGILAALAPPPPPFIVN